jgi:hypothetical protein
MMWRFDSEELCEGSKDHRERLDAWVRKIWPGSRETWENFLRKLPGFYPLDVWQSLARCGLASDALAVRSQGVARQMFPEPFPGSLEHPLDYEWRFTQESIRNVLDVLPTLVGNRQQASILCLGCPSIVVAGEAAMPSWNWTLLDRRAHLLRPQLKAARLERCDLTRETPDVPCQDVAVVDPPWYTPITKHFLAKAQMLVKPRGVVLLSFPPEGTRPGAKNELDELVNWCKQRGLNLMHPEAVRLHYKTPFFEWNSLNVAGFSARVPAWRRADLLMFQRQDEGFVDLRYTEHVPGLFSDQWKEFLVDGIKICVKTNSVADPMMAVSRTGLQRVWREEILPTVSTKFLGRSSANVVTSGNRFFHCHDTDALADALGNLANGIQESCINDDQGRLAESIAAVIQSEIAERKRYLNYMYD